MKIFDKLKDIFQTKIIQEKITVIKAASSPRRSGYNNGSGSKFPGGLSRQSASIKIHDHFRIRQTVRDMMYDSMECRALVESQVNNIVNTGLIPKSTPIASILGISPEEAEQWGERADEIFNLWAGDKKSHRSRINTFYQNQRLYELFQQRDNDIFVRFFYGRDKDQINPVQIEFIEPNQIHGHGVTSTYINAFFEDGIIRDGNNREIGYKVWVIDPKTGKNEMRTIPAIGEKSGRIFMIHGFNPEYAGQGRGYSRLTHLLQELENLTGYKLSVLQKAINQASFVGVIENELQDASQPLPGRIAGPRPEYGTSPDAQEDQTGDTLDDSPFPNWDVMPEATIRQPGGAFVGNLRRGDKWKNLQDTSPGPNFEAFCDSVYSYMAASLGTSIEVVKMQFEQNYSSSRGTLVLVWRNILIWRQEMEADFLNPVREMVLTEEIAAGRLQAPGFLDPRLRMAWLKCEWAGLPMPNIDPLKTMEADRGYVELCSQTLDDVARNLNGSSGKTNRAKNARQYEELPTPPWPRAPINQNPGGNNNGNE